MDNSSNQFDFENDDDDFHLSVNHSAAAGYDEFVQDQERRRKLEPVSEQRSLKRLAQSDLSPTDLFLKEYISGEWWKEERPSGWRADPKGAIVPGRPCTTMPDALADVSEDEEFLDTQDAFEAKYNFRFEEPDSARLVTHPRGIEDSMRRPDDRRALRRQKRKESKKRKKELQEEELKQAKNAKKREIMKAAEDAELKQLELMREKMNEERLALIRQVGALKSDEDDEDDERIGSFSTAEREALMNQLDLDGDFDPDDYDKKMSGIFNDDWYSKKEVDKRTLKTAPEPVAKKSGKSTVAVDTAAMLDELYAMEFEDTLVDGVKTRFQYTPVVPHSYGMTIEEILNEDDADLNAKVSIKQLAPYRTDRNITQTWQQLKKATNARFRRKQSRMGA